MTATLTQTIPALPVRDAAAATAFYRDRLGFEVLHTDDGFVVVKRDAAEVHLWQSGDESWRERDTLERPVRSGAESFIAGTTSCRIRTDDVGALYDELHGAGVLHPVSEDGVTTTDFGTREFSVIDVDGNLISFFAWVA